MTSNSAPATSGPSPRSTASLKSRIFKVDAAGLLACLALAAGAYLLGVQPVFDARAEVEEKRRLIDEQTHNADDAERLLAGERTKLQSLQRQLATTSVKLSPASDLNRRLAVISELVESHGLEVQALDPGTPTTDPAIGKFALVPIRLSGLGRFAAVSGFLHELLGTRYADMEVRSLSLAAGPPAPLAARGSKADPTKSKPGTPENPDEAPAERGSFTIELRWYAAPAGSAAESSARE